MIQENSLETKRESTYQKETLSPERRWVNNILNKNTSTSYQYSVKAFLEFIQAESSEDLYRVDISDILQFREFLIQKGKSKSTVNQRLASLSSLFDELVESQVCKINPVASVKRFKSNYDNTEARALSTKEVTNLLSAPKKLFLGEYEKQRVISRLQYKRDQALLSLLFYSGCRASEICTLLKEDFIEINDASTYYIMRFRVTKGGKKRSLAINSLCSDTLLEYLEEACTPSDKSPLFYKILNPKHHDPYFQVQIKRDRDTREYQALTRYDITNIWNKYTKLESIKNSSPHCARVTHITESLKSMDMDKVRRSVGHSLITTTQKYDHRVPQAGDSSSMVLNFNTTQETQEDEWNRL